MRVVILSFAVVFALPVLARAAEDDAKAMEGTWVLESAELAGKPLAGDASKSIKLTMKDGKYTVVAESPDHGTVTIDSTKKPKTMDIAGTDGPNKGKKFLAIYEIQGDTLKICYDLSGKERPTEFKSKEKTQLFLVTYKRAKP